MRIQDNAKSYPITQWPEEERPRERLLRWGAESLREGELVALLLRTGSRQRSAVDLAQQILATVSEQGGWKNIQAADLKGIKGVGEAKAAILLAALELGKRQWLQEAVPEKLKFSSSRQAYEFCRQHLAGKAQEAFLVMALDAKNKLLGSRIISLGTLTQSLVHPREVFQPALSLRAAGIILAHNHPSGDPKPSHEDGELTRRMKSCSELLSIPLIDHLVVGKDSYFSYADAGWVVQSPSNSRGLSV